MPCRNFSPSSGVIRSQRSDIRLRKLKRWKPRPPLPPNRIRQRASSPTACQNVISRHPNNAGSSQFHRCSTTSPPITMKITTSSGARKIHFFLMLGPSFLRNKLFVNALQSFAQMQHRVALAREQGIDVYTAFCRQFFEAAPFQFVGDEYFTLLVGQFAERKFQLIKKYVADVERFRPGIGRRQQVFDL